MQWATRQLDSLLRAGLRARAESKGPLLGACIPLAIPHSKRPDLQFLVMANWNSLATASTASHPSGLSNGSLCLSRRHVSMKEGPNNGRAPRS